MVPLLFYLIAVILLTLAAFGIGWRVSFGWLGLALWLFTSTILGHVD